MEILLLIAIIAVGASALYVAATFNARSRKNFSPLMGDAAKDISHEIEVASGELRQEIQAIAPDLQQNRELIRYLETANGELRQQMRAIADELRQYMRAIADELRRNRELVNQLDEQTGMRQDQLGRDMALLHNRVAELGESLAQQSTRLARIHSYAMRQEMLADSSAKEVALLLAMVEAESHVDIKGWGGPPHLYALTEKTSTAAADRELAAEPRDGRPDALVPVEYEPLPDGDLIEVLAGIRWPADVVGCVLVTELAALPHRVEEDVPVDPGATGQWTDPHPDGRPARLAVGVCKTGEQKCGLRIKGEDDIQVRTELAEELVAALLDTF